MPFLIRTDSAQVEEGPVVNFFLFTFSANTWQFIVKVNRLAALIIITINTTIINIAAVARVKLLLIAANFPILMADWVLQTRYLLTDSASQPAREQTTAVHLLNTLVSENGLKFLFSMHLMSALRKSLYLFEICHRFKLLMIGNSRI